MRRVALLATIPLLAAACGSNRVELKAERTLQGTVEHPSARDVPENIRAVSQTRAVLRFPGGRALATRDGGRTWRTATWPAVTTTIEPAVALPREARKLDACSKAFFDVSNGLLICGFVPGAGSQRKLSWSWNGKRWTKIADRISYGYVGDLDAVGPRTYVHHTGRGGDQITTDGGHSWRSATPPESSAISSWATTVAGWALNGHGDVFRTHDGGRHWRFVAPSFWPAGETSFCSPRVGYGTGTPNVSGYSEDRTVYATTDGGRTWRRRAHLKLGAGTLTCVAREEVVLSGYPPDDAQEPVLLRSRDGGRHWTKLRVPKGAYPPQVQSRNLYFAPIGDNAGWITFNGARTWRRVGAGDHLQSIAFLTPSTGFAVLLRRIGLKRVRTWVVRTTDGGKTWRRVPTAVRNFRPTGVIVADGTVWVRGLQRVLRTRDGGRHWDEIQTGGWGFPSNPRFASSTLGVESGDHGLLVTRDGGVTWRWTSRRSYS
jgi:photosystem II stability/assembly factor-like uncharacterized protein